MKQEFAEKIRAARESEEFDSEIIEGVKFKVLLYSTDAAEEIQNIVNNFDYGSSGVVDVFSSLEKMSADEMTPVEILGRLKPQELRCLVKAVGKNASSVLTRAIIKHGLGPNNFCENQPPEDDDVVQIMEYPRFAAELCDKVSAHNSPLAQKTAEK